jgi:uncharacterized protein (TIGR02145 family)
MTKTIKFLTMMLIAAITMLSFSSCSKDDDDVSIGIGEPTATTDPGVVINGIRWATRNVDEFGTFVEKEEDYGKFYQWNRKKAWSVGSVITNEYRTTPTGDTWEKANDPIPAGWRLPTKDELKKLEWPQENLAHESKVQNGIKGILITDKNTGASMFLPYAGVLEWSYKSGVGQYWSSHTSTDERATYLNIGDGSYISPILTAVAYLVDGYRRYGYSIRPVKE